MEGKRIKRKAELVVTGTVMLGTLAACGGSSPKKAQAPAPRVSARPAAVASLPANLPPPQTAPDPTKFTTDITNPYFPLTKGTVKIFDGTRDGKPVHSEFTVTGETKTIMGIKTAVIRDIVTGAVEEKTTDWYAQDSDGNVWYFGEDTKEYAKGVVTSTAGTWEAGVDGALPGIAMQAHPTPGGYYRQEFRPGVAEDVARIQQVDAKTTTAGGSYEKVVVTEDTDALDNTKLEHKYFAPGVGTVKSEGMVNGHKEYHTLTSSLTGK